jgi:hypothetical protein
MRAAYRPSAILRIVVRGVDATATAGDDVGDGTEEVVTGLLVGPEEDGTDSRAGVLVLDPWVCGGGLAAWVQAATPRATTTGATTIRARRVSEVFMIDPSGVLG